MSEFNQIEWMNGEQNPAWLQDNKAVHTYTGVFTSGLLD